jgi:hypothetical protein
VVRADARRDVAALAITEALARPHLARQVVNVVDGERQVADAFDAIEPLPLPLLRSPPARVAVPLGVAQADNPPDDPKMIEPDASRSTPTWSGWATAPSRRSRSATTIPRQGFRDGTVELRRAPTREAALVHARVAPGRRARDAARGRRGSGAARADVRS